MLVQAIIFFTTVTFCTNYKRFWLTIIHLLMLMKNGDMIKILKYDLVPWYKYIRALIA